MKTQSSETAIEMTAFLFHIALHLFDGTEHSLTFSKQRKSPGLYALGTDFTEHIQSHYYRKKSEPTVSKRELTLFRGYRGVLCSRLLSEPANWPAIINLPFSIKVLRIRLQLGTEELTHFSDLLLTIYNVTEYIKWAFKNHLSPLFASIGFKFKSFQLISYKRFLPVSMFTIASKARAADPLYSFKSGDTEACGCSTS